jgi:hypothetical protein
VEKEKIIKLMKWVTCGFLLANAAILFLPYAEAGNMGLFNPVQMIQGFMEETSNSAPYVAEVIIDFIVPCFLVFIAGLLLIGKIRIVKCVITTILSIGALLLYIYYLTSDFFGGMHGNETIGFWLNFTIAIIGVVMPTIIFIFTNKGKNIKSEKEKAQ